MGAAEAARNAAVDAQAAADAWRKGSTPNSGPVLALNQNPDDHDTYGTTFDKLADELKAKQDFTDTWRKWGVKQEGEYNAWRGVPHITADSLGWCSISCSS